MASETVPTEHIEAGEFSDYVESINGSSFTESLKSSVIDYVYSRRYHRYGGENKYFLPNDEKEQDRLDFNHHTLLLLLGGRLHTAPLEDKPLHRVLDVGTGTGIWALDFGETHPETEVIGVDLSPIQPSWVYPNVKFEVDDLSLEWTWPKEYFDYIHVRAIADGLQDTDRFVQRAFAHLTPGGYVEVVEYVDTIQTDGGASIEGTAMREFVDAYTAAKVKAKYNHVVGEVSKAALEKAGFEDVTLTRFTIPWGPWSEDKILKEVGLNFAASMDTGLEAYGIYLMTNFGDYTVESARKLFKDTIREVMSGKYHVFQNLEYVVGRKPEAKS